MPSNTYIVVGDAYQSMAGVASVVTESRMLELLEHEKQAIKNVVIGQGVSIAARRALKPRSTSERLPNDADAPSPLALTHKHDARHVLIGAPSIMPDASYRAALRIDDLSDRLSDHVTGSHISGMLLIEATRQLVIAALELRFSKDGEPMPWGIGWNALSTRFLAFVFPLPASLTARISEDQSKIRPTQRSVFVDVTVEQAGQVALETRYDITLVQRSTFQALEAKRAKRAAEKFSQDGDAEPLASLPSAP